LLGPDGWLEMLEYNALVAAAHGEFTGMFESLSNIWKKASTAASLELSSSPPFL